MYIWDGLFWLNYFRGLDWILLWIIVVDYSSWIISAVYFIFGGLSSMDYFCCIFRIYIFGALFVMDSSRCVFLMPMFDGLFWLNCFVDHFGGLILMGYFGRVFLDIFGSIVLWIIWEDHFGVFFLMDYFCCMFPMDCSSWIIPAVCFWCTFLMDIFGSIVLWIILVDYS